MTDGENVYMPNMWIDDLLREHVAYAALGALMTYGAGHRADAEELASYMADTEVEEVADALQLLTDRGYLVDGQVRPFNDGDLQ